MNKGAFILIRRKVGDVFEYLCLRRRDPVILNQGTEKERIAYPAGTFELAGGGVEEGESPKEAVIREFWEEFSWDLTSANGSLKELAQFNKNSSESSYFLVDLPPEMSYWMPKISDEHIDYQWLTMSEIDTLGRYEMVALFRDMIGLAEGDTAAVGVDADFYFELVDGVYKCTYGEPRIAELATTR